MFFFQNKPIHLNHNCLLCSRTAGEKGKKKAITKNYSRFPELCLANFSFPGHLCFHFWSYCNLLDMKPVFGNIKYYVLSDNPMFSAMHYLYMAKHIQE